MMIFYCQGVDFPVGNSRRQLRARLTLLGIVVLIAVLILTGRHPIPEAPPVAAPLEVKVAWCYDGDSFRSEDNREIRILGIDCPERDAPFAEEARDFAANELHGKSVRLETDGDLFETGYYGRTLAYVSVDGADYGETILEAGLARVYRYTQCSRRDRYLQLERVARGARKGLWGDQ